MRLILVMTCGLFVACTTVPRMQLDDSLVSNSKEIKVTSQPGRFGADDLVFGPYKAKVKPGPTLKMGASAGGIASANKSETTYKITFSTQGTTTEVNCSRGSASSSIAFKGSSASTIWSCQAGDKSTPDIALKTLQNGSAGSGGISLGPDGEHKGEATVRGTKIEIKSSNVGIDGESGRSRTGYNLLIDGKVVAAADLGGEWSLWVTKGIPGDIEGKLALVAALMFIDSQVRVT